jgi:gas vesicle protein
MFIFDVGGVGPSGPGNVDIKPVNPQQAFKKNQLAHLVLDNLIKYSKAESPNEAKKSIGLSQSSYSQLQDLAKTDPQAKQILDSFTKLGITQETLSNPDKIKDKFSNDPKFNATLKTTSGELKTNVDYWKDRMEQDKQLEKETPANDTQKPSWIA